LFPLYSSLIALPVCQLPYPFFDEQGSLVPYDIYSKKRRLSLAASYNNERHFHLIMPIDLLIEREFPNTLHIAKNSDLRKNNEVDVAVCSDWVGITHLYG
jgi:hypothetical protein